MLITTLLANHPEALIDIVRHTPLWVGGLLIALTALGLSAVRTRDVHRYRLLAMPVAMGALALWGVDSAFNGTGRLAALLAVWAVCYAIALVPGLRWPQRQGVHYDPATGRFRLPGSWLPMALILGIFSLKYVIGVQLAIEPPIAHDAAFAYTVSAVYGLLSGVLAARTARVLRAVRPGRVAAPA